MRAPIGDEETGASGVEVALLLTLVAGVVLSAVSFLGRSGDSTLEEAGRGIDEPTASAPGSGGSGPSPDPGPGGGSGGPGGSGGGGTTPTGPAATTTEPSPTTAPAPTTTAAPTTTTAAPPVPASAQLSNGRAIRRGSRWDAAADLRLAAEAGRSLEGSATVEVRTRRADGRWATSTVEVPLDDQGAAGIESGSYNRTGSSRIDLVEYTVVAVEFDDDGPWDGEETAISISRP